MNRILLALVLLAAAAMLLEVPWRGIDPDELEHLHAACAVLVGRSALSRLLRASWTCPVLSAATDPVDHRPGIAGPVVEPPADVGGGRGHPGFDGGDGPAPTTALRRCPRPGGRRGCPGPARLYDHLFPEGRRSAAGCAGDALARGGRVCLLGRRPSPSVGGRASRRRSAGCGHPVYAKSDNPRRRPRLLTMGGLALWCRRLACTMQPRAPEGRPCNCVDHRGAVAGGGRAVLDRRRRRGLSRRHALSALAMARAARARRRRCGPRCRPI